MGIPFEIACNNTNNTRPTAIEKKKENHHHPALVYTKRRCCPPLTKAHKVDDSYEYSAALLLNPIINNGDSYSCILLISLGHVRWGVYTAVYRPVSYTHLTLPTKA